MASEPKNKDASGHSSGRIFFDILLVVFLVALLWVMRDALSPLLIGVVVIVLGIARHQEIQFDSTVLGIACLLLGVWFFSEVAGIMWPFVCSFVLSYLLAPLVRVLQKHMPRNVAIAVIVIAVLGVLSGLGAIVIPKVISEFGELARRLPTYGESIVAVYERALAWVQFELGYKIPLEDIQQWLVTRLPAVGRVFADQTTSALKGLSSGVAVLLNFLMVPFVTFYILRDYDKIGDLTQRLLPPRHVPHLKTLFTRIDDVLGHYIRGQLLVCSFIALLTSIGLGALGIRYAVLLGIMAGFLNLIPFVGMAIALGVSALIAGLDADPLYGVLKVVGVFVVVQGIEGNFLSPKVVGERVGLHPAWVMFSLVAFAHFWGFLGMVVAIPFAAVINILVKILTERYFSSQYYQRFPDDVAS